jgi:hypothetical protein
MRFVILHYHILKNAGSTVEEILYNSFREDFARFDTMDRDGSIPHADLLSFLESHPRVKAVSSHQIRHPVPRAPGFIFFDWCFLRDPMDRIRSMYDYFREKPSEGDPVSELANQLGLGEYAARLIEEIPWYANDIHVNLLANGIANDPPSKEDLERATRIILKTSFLGVVDCFDRSLIAGQYSLHPIFPGLKCAHPPVNVSKGMGRTLDARIEELREACTPQVYAELLRLNSLDCALLSRARAEVERRFNLVPDGIDRLRALESSG